MKLKTGDPVKANECEDLHPAALQFMRRPAYMGRFLPVTLEGVPEEAVTVETGGKKRKKRIMLYTYDTL